MEIPANEERQCEETVMGEMLRGLGLIGLLVVTLILVGSSPGRTAESFSVYEDWTGGSIRADRWLGFETFGGQEVKREVSGRFLRMRLRRQGSTGSDLGLTNPAFPSNQLNLANPPAVDQLRVVFNVNSLTVSGCPANTTPI